MYEVVLKAAHDGFYCNLSRKFPSIRKFFWCNYSNDIIEILVDNPEEYSLVMNEVSQHKSSGIIEESMDQLKFHLIVKSCTCTDENTVEKYIENLDVLHIFPVITEKGWEYHRLLFFKHEDFEELIQRLTENGFILDILRKVPFDGFIGGSLSLNTETLMSGLTEKQVDALLTAYRYGYYYLPRRANVQTIADRIQVPRTTYQEHLKKAENKLMAALIPYLQMFKHSTNEQRKRLKIKVSNDN